jgi:peptide/nickel transport system substrate-binding protein
MAMLRLIHLGLMLALTSAALAQTSETPRRGGTLVYAVSLGEPDTYDCHAAVSVAVLHRVAPHYSTLVRIDQARYPQAAPDAAESWTISPDGLVYTFRLRDGIRFHDGSTLTSADVKASYERLRNPPQGVISARQQHFRDIAAIETPDERTVLFRLARPNAAMLTVFASPWNCLYSARRLAENASFPARNVMGTGPFRFVEHVAGGEWRGARFEGYFRADRPYLDGFRAVSVAGPALANALAAGQALTDFRGVTPAERDRIVAARGAQVRAHDADQPGMLMLTFNTTRAPFDDARVRRALSLAIDRWGGAPAMARLSIFSGVGGFQRLDSAFGRSRAELEAMPGFRPDMAANRAEARRLLAEAGQGNLTATFMNRPVYTALGVFLIDQWRQVGATITQEQPENQRFFASRRDGNFDILMDGLQEFVDEPSLQLVPFLSRDVNPTNISRAIDRTVDALYERQARTLNPTERREAVRQIEERLLNEAYTVPLYWARRYVTIAAELRGFHMTPSALVGQDLADLWLAQ